MDANAYNQQLSLTYDRTLDFLALLAIRDLRSSAAGGLDFFVLVRGSAPSVL
jgi:hypothetical protein